MILDWHILGATSSEQIALFNSCTIVNVMRDYDECGRTEWRIYSGHSVMGGGFHESTAKTRKSAIAYARKYYPSLEIWAQHGESETMIQGAKPAIIAAREKGN